MSYERSLSSPTPTHHYSDVFSLDTPQPSNETPTIRSSQLPDNHWEELVKIRGLHVFKWMPSKAAIFIHWWQSQTWYKERLNEFPSIDSQINWGSTARTSLSWRHFDQGARKSSGEPVIVCQRCSVILIHPCIKASGTSTMSSHLKSAGCTRKSSQHTTLRQSQLRLSQSSPVSNITISITINSTNYLIEYELRIRTRPKGSILQLCS